MELRVSQLKIYGRRPCTTIILNSFYTSRPIVSFRLNWPVPSILWSELHFCMYYSSSFLYSLLGWQWSAYDKKLPLCIVFYAGFLFKRARLNVTSLWNDLPELNNLWALCVTCSAMFEIWDVWNWQQLLLRQIFVRTCKKTAMKLKFVECNYSS